MEQSTNDHGRLESFSDGVFAFAATLLVVSLEIPESFDLLKKQLLGFLSFGASFAVLVLLWRAHYSFFRRTAYRDNFIMAINMTLLFVILYFIYPMKFLASLLLNNSIRAENKDLGIHSAQDLSQLFTLYGLGFVLVFMCLSLLYWRAEKKDTSNRSQLSFYKRHFFIFVLMGLLSMILSMTHIGIRYGFPGFIYALLGPACYWHSRWSEKREQKQAISTD